MASVPPIAAGQRFRDVQGGSFGGSRREWVVQVVITGSDGIAYARLAAANDPTRIKTLSFSALAERHRYERVEG